MRNGMPSTRSKRRRIVESWTTHERLVALALSFLDMNQRRGRAALVCRAWKRASDYATHCWSTTVEATLDRYVYADTFDAMLAQSVHAGTTRLVLWMPEQVLPLEVYVLSRFHDQLQRIAQGKGFTITPSLQQTGLPTTA